MATEWIDKSQAMTRLCSESMSNIPDSMDNWKEAMQTAMKVVNMLQSHKMIYCVQCKYWWRENQLCTHPKTTDGSICCLECGPDFYCGYAEELEHE